VTRFVSSDQIAAGRHYVSRWNVRWSNKSIRVIEIVRYRWVELFASLERMERRWYTLFRFFVSLLHRACRCGNMYTSLIPGSVSLNAKTFDTKSKQDALAMCIH
jgi:hypothetical protein